MIVEMDYLKLSRTLSSLASKIGLNREHSYRLLVKLYLPNVDKAIAIIQQHQPFLILGTGRTGTTWLSHLLGMIPGTWVEHEPVLADRYAHAQAFMNPEVAKDYLTGFRLAEMALRCQIQKPSVYGEVNGNLRRHAAAFKELIPNIRIIHIVRDGRSFVRSVWSRGTFTEKDERVLLPPAQVLDHETWNTMSRFEKICWTWTYENSYLREHTDSTVRFEDITSDYERFNLQVLRPLGLSLDRSVWVDAVQQPKNETKRFTTSSWEEWGCEQREQFRQLCGQEMLQYGYDLGK